MAQKVRAQRPPRHIGRGCHVIQHAICAEEQQGVSLRRQLQRAEGAVRLVECVDRGDGAIRRAPLVVEKEDGSEPPPVVVALGGLRHRPPRLPAATVEGGKFLLRVRDTIRVDSLLGAAPVGRPDGRARGALSPGQVVVVVVVVVDWPIEPRTEGAAEAECCGCVWRVRAPGQRTPPAAARPPSHRCARSRRAVAHCWRVARAARARSPRAPAAGPAGAHTLATAGRGAYQCGVRHVPKRGRPRLAHSDRRAVCAWVCAAHLQNRAARSEPSDLLRRHTHFGRVGPRTRPHRRPQSRRRRARPPPTRSSRNGPARTVTSAQRFGAPREALTRGASRERAAERAPAVCGASAGVVSQARLGYWQVRAVTGRRARASHLGRGHRAARQVHHTHRLLLRLLEPRAPANLVQQRARLGALDQRLPLAASP
eukprot:3813568-Prymnesium_polylepis.1